MSNRQNIRILHCNFQYDSVSAGHKSVMYDTIESSTFKKGQNKDLDIHVAAVWTEFHNSLVTLHSLHSSNNELMNIALSYAWRVSEWGRAFCFMNKHPKVTNDYSKKCVPNVCGSYYNAMMFSSFLWRKCLSWKVQNCKRYMWCVYFHKYYKDPNLSQGTCSSWSVRLSTIIQVKLMGYDKLRFRYIYVCIPSVFRYNW